MQVKQLKEDGLNHELEITIPAGDIETRTEDRLKEVGKTVRLPGFRPGKAPMQILKQKYGRAIMGEVLESTVNETSQKALEDKGLQPALQPKIEVKSFDEGKDLTYTMAIEILPQFEVVDLKGIKLEKPVAKIEDKHIDDALKRIASQNRASEPVKGDRAAKKGDIVVIDFHGRTADDNVEHEGMHGHGHQLELGGGQFIEGFEDQLIGKKVGDKVEVKVTFPDPYQAADLAGRDAIFDVDIKELREPKEAEVNDEFAQQLGLDDLAALKNAVKEQLEKEYGVHTRLKIKKQLLDYLDEKHSFAVPQGMLDLEYDNIIRQIEAQNQGTKVSDEEKEELKEISERRVRLGLILSDVGKSNNIQVADAELQRAVIAEAQKFPGQEKEVFDYYSKNQNALEALRAPVFEDKVVDFILELAEISEKSITPEELTADEDGEAEEKPKKKTSSKKAAAKKDTGKKPEKAKPAAKKAPAKKAGAKKKKAS